MIYNEDCLVGMSRLEDNSVDCILCDLPYNLTDCAWDKNPIDLDAMWIEFKRILKPYNSAVMFASGKFTHKLIASNWAWFKYKWIWVKNALMRRYEEICIFSDGVINHKSVSTKRMKYNPQELTDCKILKDNARVTEVQVRSGANGFIKSGANATKTQIHNPHPENFYLQEQTGYPSDVLYFNTLANGQRLHPTQKPVALLEYLIKTYTNEGETILDATMGVRLNGRSVREY